MIATETPALLRWPGHVPGHFRFGWSPSKISNAHLDSPDHEHHDETGDAYGVHRGSIGWARWDQVIARICADQAAQRLPWISIRPPVPGVSGWREVASGQHDHSIYRLGRRMLEVMTSPTIVTFDDQLTHPTDAGGRFWASAYCRFHDTLAAATGLRLLAEAPIVSDSIFDPANVHQRRSDWLTTDVLDRSTLLGVSILEDSSGETFEQRVPRVLDSLASRGFAHLMIGVTASGRSEDVSADMATTTWLNDSLGWVAQHTDQVTLVCYTPIGEGQGAYWPRNQLGREHTGTQTWADRAIT